MTDPRSTPVHQAAKALDRLAAIYERKQAAKVAALSRLWGAGIGTGYARDATVKDIIAQVGALDAVSLPALVRAGVSRLTIDQLDAMLREMCLGHASLDDARARLAAAERDLAERDGRIRDLIETMAREGRVDGKTIDTLTEDRDTARARIADLERERDEAQTNVRRLDELCGEFKRERDREKASTEAVIDGTKHLEADRDRLAGEVRRIQANAIGMFRSVDATEAARWLRDMAAAIREACGPDEATPDSKERGDG